ncbi:glycosyltransferase family 4 protein [Caldisericum sp.]|uniref:glycosyltransferase family 4 protein n=1 Tax=Caldisericum sp. TaxID=2499687 RepID=UPI003D1226F6
MTKNLLIIKGLDTDKFLKNQSLKDWDILDIKEFIKQFKNIRKSQYNHIVCGYQDLSDKNLQYPIQFFLLLLRANKKYFLDNHGIIKDISFLRFIFDTFLFILELFFDLFLVVFSWLILFIFYLLPKRKSLFRSPNESPAIKEKKIIYLRTDNFRSLQEGGSFTHFRGVVKGLYKLGYNIHYIGSGKIEVSNLDFSKTIIPYPKNFNLPEIPEIYYNWRFVPKALKIIRKEKPLFIYQRHSIFNVCGAILSQLTGTSLILEYNGSEPWIRQKWGGLLIFKQLCYFMENFSLKRAKIITVVSKPIKDELIKRNIPNSKILVNYNGVDTEEFNPNIDGSEIRKKLNLEDKIIIGAVSTFGAWHGMPVLAKAVKPIIDKIQDTRYKIHFLFIGDGVQRPLCERIIKESGMENYVTFIGIVPYKEIPKYLAACDILVSPHIPNADGTPFFGSPTKLFEYMAMGKPIVASKLGQIGEILKDRETALLVEPGNIDELVRGINELIKDKNLSNSLGNNVRLKVVAEFSWFNNVQKLIQLFKQQ